MSKKAFLVDFGFTTRVIAEDNANANDIARLAIEKICENMIADGIGTYVNQDNIGEIKEDAECPFGTFQSDNK